MTHDPDIKPTGPSAGNLLSEALAHVSALVRNEVDLARAEIDENLKTAGVAIGLIVGAVAVALAALHVLAAALVAALTELGIPAGWSALIVGVGLALIAWAMVQKGVIELKLRSLAPTRTAKNVQRDAQTVMEVYNDK
ncbi:phage holin family protein [Roseovarius nubinhibens]|uniref:phage holin family protein n=1 Tax=Roseovarius nubinhibens TaxID=314263 RepID=UPI001C08C425|nr:phage holin family protein [Roseovarius nubinhibens]MBU2999176.1 phage holin family protein [Roseovarius nubinhibens]